MDDRKLRGRQRVKQMVEETARVREEEKREQKGDYFARFLNDDVPFDDWLTLSDPEMIRLSDKITDDILKKKFNRVKDKNQKMQDGRILIANLLTNKDKYPTKISLDRNEYVSKKGKRTSHFITTLVNEMFEQGWIHLKSGNEKIARLTRIWPSEKLMKHFEPFTEVDFFGPLDLINVVDQYRNLCTFKDTKESNDIRKVLRDVNLMNREALVQLKTSDGFKRLNTDLRAIFNNRSFQYGGRFYTCGPHGYQSLKKEERSEIYINRKRTVELDFSGMQIRLLYALEKVQYPDDKDPYTAVIENHPELRDFTKTLLLALLNASSNVKSVAAANFMLYRENEYYQTLKTIGIQTKDLVESFKNAHPKIAHHFGTAIGLKLMRQDARIALEVIKQFIEYKIAILAIHDSFIVEEKYERKLKKTMQKAFEYITGGFTCPVK